MKRVLTVIAVTLLTLALVAVGSWAWTTRAQGHAQAVEFADATLSPTLLKARVLALGEATHGNAEYQQLREELTRKAAASGFRTVVLEEDFGATAEVDAFVQGGPGTAAEAANRFGFRINKTTQVAAWLQWMRDHNASVPAGEHIRLVGMDVQRTAPSLRLVAAALADADPKAAAVADAAAKKDALTQADLDTITHAVDALPASTRDARIATTSLAAGLRLESAGVAYGSVREQAMFDNLATIVEQSRGGVVLLAHNGHVAKVGFGAVAEPVGAKAAARWGEGYRVIGTDFVHTTFLSGDGADRQEWTLTHRTPLRGMFDGTRVGYLDLAECTGDNRALVDAPATIGTAGESFTTLQKLVPFLHTVRVVPSEAFDALILVEDATPTTML